MRKLIALVSILLVISCQNQAQNDIEGFNKLLGNEKAKVFNNTVESFRDFLVLNYPDYEDENQRIYQFLKTLTDTKDYNYNFIIDKEKSTKIVAEWEKSGLRKEVWLFGNEEYTSSLWDPTEEQAEEEIMPITRNKGIEVDVDLSKYFDSNTGGLYLYGLDNYAPNDTIIQSYVEGKSALGNISYLRVAEGFKKLKINYHEPFFIRILVVEFYYNLIKRELETEE
ncbi:hypothetical protein KEM09_21180 [Carboxylicivirga mesophila]|uniref:Uncharacterized protein n=1 Tax=Carboxylicivirga mesophila TaxID=1166478 RepID=A0ABS5KG11_9BACT|nr:hypothetical protein [Carboxylicivirga mesophila]MBS2213935.1 hypothetical protein [Carboxylicivirga mesophila]